MRSNVIWYLVLLVASGCAGRARSSDQGSGGTGATAGPVGAAGSAATAVCHQDTDCPPACLSCGDTELECGAAYCDSGVCRQFGQPRCDCASKHCGDTCDQCATTHSLCISGFCDNSGSCVLNLTPKPECPTRPSSEQGGTSGAGVGAGGEGGGQGGAG